MNHSFTNLLIHVIWSTNNQEAIISSFHQNELYAFVTTLIKAQEGIVFSIGGTTDHIHVLMLLPADISLSSFIGHIKACSSKWIKTKGSLYSRFAWQHGYVAFSTQPKKLDVVCSYIRNDAKRHLTKSYKDELLSILDQQNIAFNETYFLKNTHTKINAHLVWSTYNRYPHLEKALRQIVYDHISKVISENKGIVYAIGGVEDHVHVFIEMPKDKSVSDMVKDIKTTSTHFITNQDNNKYRDFHWQVGYGAFTVSYSNIKVVREYVENQEIHHQKMDLNDEWNELLLDYGSHSLPCWGYTAGFK